VLPALVGPLISGLVTEHAGWRWVFLGLVPLVGAGLLLLLPALRGLPGPAGRTTGAAAPRWWALLAGAGIGALQYAGQRLDPVAVAVAAGGLAALLLGLRALLPRGTARAAGGLPAVVAARGLLAGSFFGMDTLLPLTLTRLHGYGPTGAGIPLTAGALGWAVASHLQGRRPDLSRVALLRAGFLLVAAGLAGTAVVALPGVGGWPAYVTWGVAGLGMGLGMPSAGVLLLDRSPEHRRGADSAAFQIADVTGSALCVGLAGVLVAAAASGLLPLAAAVLVAVAVLAGLALVGAVVAPRAGRSSVAEEPADLATTLGRP
jgi:MFS family permease